MATLIHSEVRRIGLTSSSPPKLETKSVHAFFDKDELRFSFQISSKGGGTTFLCLAVGKRDLPALLEYVAGQTPELFDALFEAAAIARAGLVGRKKSAKSSKKTRPVKHAKKTTRPARRK
jgi:hypothetical protein